MVDMKVREQDVDLRMIAIQVNPQFLDARSTVENQTGFVTLDLNARSVAPVFRFFGSWRRHGSPAAPDSDFHFTFVFQKIAIAPTKRFGFPIMGKEVTEIL